MQSRALKKQEAEALKLNQRITLIAFELMAVLFALKAICSRMKSVHNYIYLDNTTTVNYLNSTPEAHSTDCNSAAKDIWQFCMERERSGFLQLLSQEKIILKLTENPEFLLIIRSGIAKARHISTSYKSLVEPPIDLFVSRLNAQVSCYASWRPDPGTTYVDVFSITWET